MIKKKREGERIKGDKIHKTINYTALSSVLRRILVTSKTLTQGFHLDPSPWVVHLDAGRCTVFDNELLTPGVQIDFHEGYHLGSLHNLVTRIENDHNGYTNVACNNIGWRYRIGHPRVVALAYQYEQTNDERKDRTDREKSCFEWQ